MERSKVRYTETPNGGTHTHHDRLVTVGKINAHQSTSFKSALCRTAQRRHTPREVGDCGENQCSPIHIVKKCAIPSRHWSSSNDSMLTYLLRHVYLMRITP